MQLGNLIIYDNNGKIWYQSGEMEGAVNPITPPVGLPYKILPYGTMETHKLSHVDIETDEPVLIPYEVKISAEEELVTLKAQIEELKQGRINIQDISISKE